MKAYDEGREAGLRGCDMLENPYTAGTCQVTDTQGWFAGWLDGRKARKPWHTRFLDYVLSVVRK